MPPTTETPRPEQREQAKRGAARRCGTVGVLGAFTCMFACCLPPILVALGAGASTAVGMADMDHSSAGSHGTFGDLLHLLHRIAPGLLAVSVVLIAGAFALRRPIAAIPALLAGVVLYVSMHVQSDPTVMYTGMVVAYGTWIGLYLWTRRTGPARTPETENGCH